MGISSLGALWQELRGQLASAALYVSAEPKATSLAATLLAQRAVSGIWSPSPALQEVAVDPLSRDAYRSLYSRFESARLRLGVG